MFTYWGLCVYSTNMPLVEFFHFLTKYLKISILDLCRKAFSQNHFSNNSCTRSAISIKKWKFAIDSVETYQSQPLLSYRKKALSLLKEGSIARICYWSFRDSEAQPVFQIILSAPRSAIFLCLAQPLHVLYNSFWGCCTKTKLVKKVQSVSRIITSQGYDVTKQSFSRLPFFFQIYSPNRKIMNCAL